MPSHLGGLYTRGVIHQGGYTPGGYTPGGYAPGNAVPFSITSMINGQYYTQDFYRGFNRREYLICHSTFSTEYMENRMP